MKPVLHARTKRLVEQYLKQPSHGLLLTGPAGVGKQFLAEAIAAELENEVLLIGIADDKSKIGIEQIQQLYTKTRTNQRITILIPEAETMSKEAQNAFLKLLEEPPSQVRFILTTAQPRALLATIRSRTQLIDVIRPSKDQLLAALRQMYPDRDFSSLLLATAGLPGRLFSLLKDEAQLNNYQVNLRQAKQFFSGDSGTRFTILSGVSYEKQWANQLLGTLATIIASLLRAPSANNHQAKLLKQATLIEETTKNLTVIQGNPKIHLTRLALEL